MSVETYEFRESTPIKRPGRQGAGRRPEPNPFEQAVKDVAGQSTAEGEAVARESSFTLSTEQGETLKQRAGRIRRFLTRAARELSESQGRKEMYRIRLVIVDGQGQPIASDMFESTSGSFVAKFWDIDAAS